MNGNRRVRPVTNIGPYHVITDNDGYDEAWTIRETRASLTRMAGDPANDAAVGLGKDLAAAVRLQLPGLDPQTMGRAMLCMSSQAGVLLALGINPIAMLNTVAAAALELVGEDYPPEDDG